MPLSAAPDAGGARVPRAWIPPALALLGIASALVWASSGFRENLGNPLPFPGEPTWRWWAVRAVVLVGTALLAVDVVLLRPSRLRRARLPTTQAERTGEVGWIMSTLVFAALGVPGFLYYATLRSRVARLVARAPHVGRFASRRERNRALRKPGVFTEGELRARRSREGTDSLWFLAVYFFWPFLQLLKVVLPVRLFSRVERDEALQHERRARLYEAVRSRPGSSFSDLKRELGVSTGVLTHHLRLLVRQEFVTYRRDGFRTRFYLRGPRVPADTYVTRTRQAILDLVRTAPGLTQKDLVHRLGWPRENVSYHARELERMGLVRVVEEGRWRRYFLVGA